MIKKKFVKNLKNIGYCFYPKNKMFFVKTLKAFQRHYRKGLINGVLDKECLVIAQNLQKTIKNSWFICFFSLISVLPDNWLVAFVNKQERKVRAL